MMHVLQGMALHSFKLLQLLPLYWICDRKTDGFFDLHSGDDLLLLFGIDPSCPRCPSRNSLNSNAIKGVCFFSSTATPRSTNCLELNSNIDCTSCGHQAPVESRREAENGPIRLMLWQRTISKASSGWFVKAELDFKRSWDKYYLFSARPWLVP